MRISIALLLLATACRPVAAPQQCFQQGDTIGWITVTHQTTGDTLARKPLEAKIDFCVK